jgi:ABC-type dipeptide/oligopeptide/nickel transport system permease subunit
MGKMANRGPAKPQISRRYDQDFPTKEARRAFFVAVVGFCLCVVVALIMANEARVIARSSRGLAPAESAQLLRESGRAFSRSLIVIAGGLILLGVGNYASPRRSRRLVTLLFSIIAFTLCTDAVGFERLALSPRSSLSVGWILAAIDVPFGICAGVVLWLIAKTRVQERLDAEAGNLGGRSRLRA